MTELISSSRQYRVNRDMARIQDRCYYWCMILNDLNPNKTEALVISRYRTVNPLMVTWSCLGFPFALVQTSTSFA